MSTSSTQRTEGQQSQNSSPWTVQQPYLTQAWNQASTNLQNGPQQTYTGQQVAQFTPEQLQNFRNMTGFQSGVPGATEAAGGALAQGGSNAVLGALGGLGGFSPTGGTQSNIDAAKSYADGIDYTGAVDAAMRDARRGVSEQALPQVARSAALTGNAFSNKRAISEGIIQRGLADKTADVSAGLHNNAYQQGLSLAEQSRQFDNNAMLNAMNSYGSLGSSAASQGIGALGSSLAQRLGLFDTAAQGGAGLRDANQAGIDNSKGMAEYGKGTSWDDLQKFYNIVGSNSWGSQSNGTSTQEQTSTPSFWNVLGGMMSSAGSLARGFTPSDRRIKTAIKRVGTLDNGLPVYSFRYRGTDNTVLGLMAQDVEMVNPAAVEEFGGIKAVNYEMATA